MFERKNRTMGRGHIFIGQIFFQKTKLVYICLLTCLFPPWALSTYSLHFGIFLSCGGWYAGHFKLETFHFWHVIAANRKGQQSRPHWSTSSLKTLPGFLSHSDLPSLGSCGIARAAGSSQEENLTPCSPF